MKRVVVHAVLLVTLVAGAAVPAGAQVQDHRPPPAGHPTGPSGPTGPTGRDLADRTRTRPEGFGIRVEEEMGTPDCPPDQVDGDADHCTSDQWLATRSPNFVNIRKRAYLRGAYEIPQGVQMTASFVATQSDTNVAVTFSGEAYVEDDVPGTDRRLFVQAVVDGIPADPGDVVFAVGPQEGTRAFVFSTTVDAGIHTVEMRWRVDERATAYLRDASLLVETGRDQPSAAPTLVTSTPPSGPNQVTGSSGWTDVPGMAASVHVGPGGALHATMSAESAVTNGARMGVRALLDGTPLDPSNVVFAQGGSPQARSMTFGATGIATGWHQVRFQWQVESGGTAVMGDRTLRLASGSVLSRPFVAAPSGVSLATVGNGLQPMPSMVTTVEVPAPGNGEVAAILSAEVGATGGVPALGVLVVDGQVLSDGIVELSDGSLGAQTKSWVFEAKDLSPGTHQLEIWWASGNGGDAYVGDRTLAVLSEVGFVPDLAEAPPFGGGHIGLDSDHIGGIEPLIGTRDVLAVLIDPGFCSGGPGTIGSGVACYDQHDVPAAKVSAALFGTGGAPGGLVQFEPDNVASYLSSMSGGRFTITKAGVAGWYPTDNPASHYYAHPGTCQGGYDEGGPELHAEAVRHADASVDFASYDRDGDGELTTNELAIVVVIPRPDGGGSQIAPLQASTCPGAGTALELDGVTLPPSVVKWNTSLDDTQEPFQFTTAAHELMHLLAGLDDLYLGADVSTFPRSMALMASGRRTTTHLNPLYKLALGWVTPVLAAAGGVYTSSAVEASNTVHVLPRYDNLGQGEELYIVENRQEGLGAGLFDEGIPDSGIGVWHVVADPVVNQLAPIGTTQAAWDASHIPADKPGSQGQMGRNGIRLIRPFDDIEGGTAVFDDKDRTQWHRGVYDLDSGGCLLVVPSGQPFRNQLAWADCQPSGYSLDFVSWPGVDMRLRVTLG